MRVSSASGACCSLGSSGSAGLEVAGVFIFLLLPAFLACFASDVPSFLPPLRSINRKLSLKLVHREYWPRENREIYALHKIKKSALVLTAVGLDSVQVGPITTAPYHRQVGGISFADEHPL